MQCNAIQQPQFQKLLKINLQSIIKNLLYLLYTKLKLESFIELNQINYKILMQEDNFQIMVSQEDIPLKEKSTEQTYVHEESFLSSQKTLVNLQRKLAMKQELLEEKDIEIQFLVDLLSKVMQGAICDKKPQQQNFDDLFLEDQRSEEEFQELNQISQKRRKYQAKNERLKWSHTEQESINRIHQRKQISSQSFCKEIRQKLHLKYLKFAEMAEQVGAMKNQMTGKDYLIQCYQKQIRQLQDQYKGLKENPNPNSSYYMKQYISLEEEMKVLQNKYENLKEKTQKQNFEELQAQIEQLLCKNQKLESDRVDISRKLNQATIIREQNREHVQKIEQYGKIINQQGKCLIQKFSENKHLEKTLAETIQKNCNLERVNQSLSQKIEALLKCKCRCKNQQYKTKPQFKSLEIFPMQNSISKNPQLQKKSILENYLQSKGGKNYLIRLAIEEHVTQLIQGLIYMGGMSFYEIEDMVANQFIGITRFFNETIKQKIKEAKQK